MKNLLIGVLLIALIGLGAYVYFYQNKTLTATGGNGSNVVDDSLQDTEGTTTTDNMVEDKTKTVVGKSAGGRDIVAYHFGEGEKEVVFVGGIHGGYEWNTVLLAYQFMDSLTANPSQIPEGVQVTVIPVLNPDGLVNVVGTTSRFTAADVPTSQATQIAGRLNGNGVDLNRNFDCDWKAQGTWQNKPVSGGTAPFSESESAAFKAYAEAHNLSAAVFWFSAAGGVYSSSCADGVDAATSALTKAYAKASGYPAHENFTSYTVTGDATNWLTKVGVPTISVLLTNHTDIEWAKNQKGITAILAEIAR